MWELEHLTVQQVPYGTTVKKNNVWKNDGETSKTLRILLESEGAAATCTIQSQMRISFVHQGFKIGGSNMT